MATCNAGPGCKIECEGGCGCVYVYDEHQCYCECFDSVQGGGAGLGLGLATKVNVSVSGLPLGRVATLLDGMLARDVLLPAARVDENVRLKMKGVRLSEALKTLGLSTQRPVAAPGKAGRPRKRTT
jgi:hypothetical protein